MIRHILFDIDDTLFPSSEFSGLARKNAINAMISMGLSYDHADLDSRLNAIIKKKGSNYPRHFDDLCRGLKTKDPGRFIAAAVAAYHDTKASIAPYPEVPLALLRLKEAGYRIFVATQGNSIKQWDKLIRLRIALFFDGVFVSEEDVGGKNVRFYKDIASRLKANPQDCMMVGDREELDITPAKKAGLRTVRVLAGRYAAVPSQADYTVRNIGELPTLLQDL